MQHDAATMCAFAQLSKGYYIHACLHSLDLRSRLLPKIGEKKSMYELATGIITDPSSFRIFGSKMYGTLLPEKRKQMGLDKADARAIHGVYIGNCREQCARSEDPRVDGGVSRRGRATRPRTAPA